MPGHRRSVWVLGLLAVIFLMGLARPVFADVAAPSPTTFPPWTVGNAISFEAILTSPSGGGDIGYMYVYAGDSCAGTPIDQVDWAAVAGFSNATYIYTYSVTIPGTDFATSGDYSFYSTDTSSSESSLCTSLTVTGSSISTSSSTSSSTSIATCVVDDVPSNSSACGSASAGTLSDFTPVALSSISPPPPAAAGTAADGLFSFTVTGLSADQVITVTITLSAPLPARTFSYWKFQGGVWSQFAGASLDSTRTIITLTLTADGSGTVTDPGGPFIRAAPTTQHPVGGVMLPSVGFTVLLPWVAMLSLLGAVSVEAFIAKRRANRR